MPVQKMITSLDLAVVAVPRHLRYPFPSDDLQLQCGYQRQYCATCGGLGFFGMGNACSTACAVWMAVEAPRALAPSSYSPILVNRLSTSERDEKTGANHKEEYKRYRIRSGGGLQRSPFAIWREEPRRGLASLDETLQEKLRINRLYTRFTP